MMGLYSLVVRRGLVGWATATCPASTPVILFLDPVLLEGCPGPWQAGPTIPVFSGSMSS